MVIKAEYQGTLPAGDLACFVLEDGRRVLSQTGIMNSLGIPQGERTLNGASKLASFIESKGLKHYLGAGFTAHANPIVFTMPQGGKAQGYEATVLVDICNAILEAGLEGDLPRHQGIVKQAQILVKSFSRIGIIALIDEATGYQAKRSRDELNELLSRYIAEELMPWVKRFPDSFFEQICRLRGWKWNPMTKQGPRAMAGVINELVYDLMPEGVSNEIRRLATDESGNRIGKLHQALTPDVGAQHLVKHVEVLTTLARASSSWARFKTSVNNYFTANTQMELF